MKDLFKNKVFVRLLICAFFMTGTSIAHNTYFGYLFRQEGGSVAGIGTAFFLMAGSEAIVMAAASRFSKKIGTEKNASPCQHSLSCQICVLCHRTQL